MKTKTHAVKILIDNGWTIEEIAKVIDLDSVSLKPTQGYDISSPKVGDIRWQVPISSTTPIYPLRLNPSPPNPYSPDCSSNLLQP